MSQRCQVPMIQEVIFKILTLTAQVLMSQKEHWLSVIHLAMLMQTGWLAATLCTLRPQPGPAPMALSSNFYLPWIPSVPILASLSYHPPPLHLCYRFSFTAWEAVRQCRILLGGIRTESKWVNPEAFTEQNEMMKWVPGLIQFLSCHIGQKWREGMTLKIMLYYRAQCMLNMDNLRPCFWKGYMAGEIKQEEKLLPPWPVCYRIAYQNWHSAVFSPASYVIHQKIRKRLLKLIFFTLVWWP